MTTQSDASPHSSTGGTPPPPKRLAPRSSNQFRVGPPFCATVSKITIYDSSNTVVTPRLCARLDRGFNLIDGEWIGYKRNYFTLVASFLFAGRPLNVAASHGFFYIDAHNRRRPLSAFKISLTSVCPEDNASAVTLVQHTAKRDRGPQNPPPVYYAVPGQLPPHLTMKSVANIRNGDKIDRCNRLFYLSQEDVSHIVHANPASILATYPRDESISLVSRYERIQFSSAGCGNRKSASTNNKHYILVIQLLGEDAAGHDVVLAYSESPPLVVRGRSPSNYPVHGNQAHGNHSNNNTVGFDASKTRYSNSGANYTNGEDSHNGRNSRDSKGTADFELPGLGSDRMRSRIHADENMLAPKRPKIGALPRSDQPSFRNPSVLGSWDSLDPQLLPFPEEQLWETSPDWDLRPEPHTPSFLLADDAVCSAEMPLACFEPVAPPMADLPFQVAPGFPGAFFANEDSSEVGTRPKTYSPAKAHFLKDLPDCPSVSESPKNMDCPKSFATVPKCLSKNEENISPHPETNQFGSKNLLFNAEDFQAPQTFSDLYRPASGDLLQPQFSQDPLGAGVAHDVLNERLDSPKSDYAELMDLENYSLINTFSTYQALPVPIIANEPLYTSTPLQLKIESRVQERVSRFDCSQVALLNPEIKRCKHGFKARTKKRATTLYSMEDLQLSDTLDAGFARFKSKMEAFRQAAECDRKSIGSSMISSLTTLSND